MRLQIIKSRGLAHNSYYFSDADEAFVVDPRRDCEVYLDEAERDCAEIKYILETHRNEDYVIGSLELQNFTEADICHSKKTPFKYGEHRLEDGGLLNIGNVRVKTLYTPGHTNDSLCYVVYDSGKNIPFIVFTGDTLFAGDVGRTDLLGNEAKREQSGKIFDSLQEKLYTLGEHTIVYPAHGGGSICGHNISDRQITSIGYEWKTNPLLRMDKDTFIETLMKNKLLKPPYFSKMEQLNLEGAPLRQKSFNPPQLSVSQFEEKMKQPGTVILDTRATDAFAGSHILGSINIWLDGAGFFPGWTLTYEQNILLVTERKEDVKAAKAYLWRLGFDKILGYLCTGIKEWRNKGKPFGHIGTLSAVELKQKLEQNEIILVDVRQPSEWKEGYIEGAEKIYVGHLKNELTRLSDDKPIATICSVGDRGGIAASILKQAGFTEVYNVLGGMKAWESLGYPTKKIESA